MQTRERAHCARSVFPFIKKRTDKCGNMTQFVLQENYVVVLGDLNARVGDGEVEGVVGKYGVTGENESGERLLDMCVEQELVIGNSFF